jgi:glycosyltransferase involved in cell wall biosynthesis
MAEAVALIIPALNEEPTIGATLDSLLHDLLTQVIVVDNGSTDRTAEVARAHSAQVVLDPRRVYGRACLAGIAAVAPRVRIIAFMDGDGSDDPADLERLLAPLDRGEADLVIGSRVLGEHEEGALTPQQQFGNRLAGWLLRLFYGARYTDLGPFRAIRREALQRLGMRDLNFGWTVEMQIKAVRHGLRVLEIPVRYRRRRAGRSKVSGSLRGSVLAGLRILWTILRYRFSG